MWTNSTCCFCDVMVMLVRDDDGIGSKILSTLLPAHHDDGIWVIDIVDYPCTISMKRALEKGSPITITRVEVMSENKAS
jgi:hypothetical protein